MVLTNLLGAGNKLKSSINNNAFATVVCAVNGECRREGALKAHAAANTYLGL